MDVVILCLRHEESGVVAFGWSVPSSFYDFLVTEF